MNEEIEKRIHEFAEQMYNAGYADRCLLTDEECIKDQQNQYMKGLNDAWECAKKIAVSSNDGGFDLDELNDIFHTRSVTATMSNYSASEAIEKIKTYEEARKQIRVGDELIYISDDGCGRRYIVTHIINLHFVDVIDECGGTTYINIEMCKKTGRHFSQVEELLKQMQEESEE